MKTRVDITYRHRHAVSEGLNEGQGQVLDEATVTEWSRDNARRRVARPPDAGRALAPGGQDRAEDARPSTYDALLVLRQVWASSGGQSGKYLAASMQLQLDLLEAHGVLVRASSRCLEDTFSTDFGEVHRSAFADLLPSAADEPHRSSDRIYPPVRRSAASNARIRDSRKTANS